MNRRVVVPRRPLLSDFPAAASFPYSSLPAQDSPSSRSQTSSQKASEPESQPTTPSHQESKKTKKGWTNDNLGDVSGSAVSQVGDERNSSPGKNAAAKPASYQVVAAYRKQLTALQAQLASLEKPPPDSHTFSLDLAHRSI